MLASLDHLESLLDPLPTSSTEVLAQTEKVLNELGLFEQRYRLMELEERKALRGGGGSSAWKDNLDDKGTEIWNRSTAAKGEIESMNQDHLMRMVAFREFPPLGGVTSRLPSLISRILQVRLVAFKVVLLGSMDPLTLEGMLHVTSHSSPPAQLNMYSTARCALLSLSTRAALSFTSISSLKVSEAQLRTNLLSAGADLISRIVLPSAPTTVPPSSTPASIKHLLDHYLVRIQVGAKEGIKTGDFGTCAWLIGKARELVGGGQLGGREIEKLASLCFQIGSELVGSDEQSGGNEENGSGDWDYAKRAAASIDWLLWGTQLVESRESKTAKSFTVSSIPLLVQLLVNKGPPRIGLHAQSSRSSVPCHFSSPIRLGES